MERKIKAKPGAQFCIVFKEQVRDKMIQRKEKRRKGKV
jgi:hypothetical protein